jgi:RHH-type proline utilization regulon transcriptional repressor/proline dehydrogenase/delta 1-pyrroline-5-carboxylate dehydrogenase
LVEEVRKQRLGKSGLDSFLYQYDLSSEEGIALMCLAEALLRVPDKATVDKLISDKISTADWKSHLGKSKSSFVNAATWGLMLTGKIYNPYTDHLSSLSKAFKGIVKRGGEPVIRKAINQAMKILGKQFVMGQTINEALKRAKELENKGYLYSYDMLGEAACTAEDAEFYFQSYQNAIRSMAATALHKETKKNPGISVKLSALHPRYEFAQKHRAIPEVTAKLKILALQAKEANISLTVDAEEADRLELSLEILENVFADSALDGWEGFGLALQSYQKRAWYVIDWLAALSQKYQRRWMVRLIKGAYWDSEIKHTQELGLEGYPVFTRKMNTDVSFLSCAQKLLKFPDNIYPMFATHNAHSVAAVLEMAKDNTDYEFQCLHGMGQALYDNIVGKNKFDRPCRIYAPVGSHEDLLPYLVRRLLENGANTSFVNRIIDEAQPIADIIRDPVQQVKNLKSIPHPSIPLPRNLYQDRSNSKGMDLSDSNTLSKLQAELNAFADTFWEAEPTTAADKINGTKHNVTNPMDHTKSVGRVTEGSEADIKKALDVAAKAAFEWDRTPVATRADYLEKTANLFEKHMSELMAIAVREAGKSIPDAVAEVREAVDFCHYYAAQAKMHLAEPRVLPGPTGEYNQLEHRGRGPIVCISPWNFPLAIFTGQVAAALVAGNPVIAKPANQTPLIAAKAVELMHQAGIPKNVLQLLPSKGSAVGKYLMTDRRVKGVVFTGSTETAQTISKTLVDRGGEIVPLIAETGGQNAMIVDSSALPEQVVNDVVASAFNSAGQRCSALRVLFVQDDIADKVIHMLKGAMEQLIVGDPGLLCTDVGPAIDTASQGNLQNHTEKMKREAKLIYMLPVPPYLSAGSYVSPCAFEIDSINILEREVFGPILHVVRYRSQDLDKVLDDINNTQYGLTLGIHSRVAETIDYIQKRMRVGNCYVNRNMVGAVVGVQPFGGEGLSGTGPKAGGPQYLFRLTTERTLSVNTAAAGGNASLMCLQDDAD